MQRIRIYKDIKIQWRVLTNKEAAPLEGRDITFEVVNRFGRIELPFTVDGNLLSSDFPGTVQKSLGAYWVTLWENKGKQGQTLVDSCSGFTLVSETCMEDDDDNTLNDPARVELDSNIQFGVRGDSAYETWVKQGHTGTQDDFLSWLRNPAEIAASDAESAAALATSAAGRADASAERADSAAASASETDRAVQAAEELRGAAESSRVSAEASRADAESARVKSEAGRASAEKAREDAEGKRASAEAERADSETSRKDAERIRENAESERKKAEMERGTAENARKSAELERNDAESERRASETARKEAEASRVNAESSRVSEFGRLKTESETATRNAQDAADIAAVNILALDISGESGDVTVTTGGDTSAFSSGTVDASTGEISLTFDYN